ncbi:division/cell wall cluster transcriptional repressor MraZ [Paracoccus sp. p4-l81]|uniref:division/cell wall cluster transcriptional repressor MraZ n=1 Tax=unclassified Paracoccus (in: a-proteobacteria) TaxID=2688777 RepID=UPI0035BAF049
MARRFRGSETYKVDGKGRVSIPARFRRVIEQGDPEWETGKRPQILIVFGDDHQKCLELYTIEAAEEIDARISRLPRGSALRRRAERKMNAYAYEAEIDEEGRLVLPAKHRDKIGLTDQAYFVAGSDTLEIWNPDTFAVVEAELDARDAEELPLGVDILSLLPDL